MNACVCFLGVTTIRAILYHFHERTVMFTQFVKKKIGLLELTQKLERY